MGKWIFKNNARHDDWSEFECSECGNRILATARDFSLHLFDYCSKCGSKMGEKVARPIIEIDWIPPHTQTTTTKPKSETVNGIDLVRCGECKWGNKDNEETLWCEHAIGGIMKPTDFCSYGERRSDDNLRQSTL